MKRYRMIVHDIVLDERDLREQFQDDMLSVYGVAGMLEMGEEGIATFYDEWKDMLTNMGFLQEVEDV